MKLVPIVLPLVLSLMLAAPAAAQRKQRHWLLRPWTDWKLMLGMGVQAAAASYDVQQTSRALRRCPLCQETNPFLGKRPGPVRLGATNAVALVGQVYWIKWNKDALRESKHWAVREAWLIHPLVMGYGHWDAGRSNRGIALDHPPQQRLGIATIRAK